MKSECLTSLGEVEWFITFFDFVFPFHDMTYGYFKDLTRRTAYDKILHNKAFDIAENPKYHGYQRGIASIVYKFFDKETSDGATTLANLLLT